MTSTAVKNGSAPSVDADAAKHEAKLAADAAKLLAAETAEAVALMEKLTAAPASRPPTYNVADGAPSARFGKQTLTVGASAKSGDAAYVLVNGSSQTGFPQAAIAVAIAAGIIPRATIKALWLAADAAAK